MAHVLLPCDLPSWGEVRRLLAKMRAHPGAVAAAKIMAEVHEISSVSLDPEDSHPILDHPGFERLGAFLTDDISGRLLPDIAEWAIRLPEVKPVNGMHYSLRSEENTFLLDRPFVVSLLANAFFSTFPRRKIKTHPTLLDFRMADFFLLLDRASHQKKLRAFLRYFEGLEPEPDGIIHFTRKLFRGSSLPSWLCSERALVPLIVRPQGNVQDAEPWVFRGCSCAASVGGDVLGESTSEESDLLFEFPELLCALCFVEGLVEGEALIVEGVRAPDTQDVNFCFLDTTDSGHRLDDRHLLLSLNKAAAAFEHEPRIVDRRRTPDGGESSDEGRRSIESIEDRIHTAPERLRRAECPMILLPSGKRVNKSLSQASSKFSMRTASEGSIRLDDEYYTADEESEPESAGPSFENSSALPDSDSRRRSSTSSHRSCGFVLGPSEDEEEDFNLQNKHERLEDFRRRIRRRTRRKLSRRSSSYSSGGSSSDMEDISEDEEDNLRPPITVVRPACSEPSLANLSGSVPDIPSYISPEALLSPTGHKQLAACSGGHLKSYSHDGVRPNLPVPFRARFRVRRRASSGSQDLDKSRSESAGDDKEFSRCPVAVNAVKKDSQLRAIILWLAASMAQLPALILYTVNEPDLREVAQVYNQVLNRKWTVGDLACEVLRFCRNQITPGHRAGKHHYLFGQFMADKNTEEGRVPVKKGFSEQSLD